MKARARGGRLSCHGFAATASAPRGGSSRSNTLSRLIPESWQRARSRMGSSTRHSSNRERLIARRGRLPTNRYEGGRVMPTRVSVAAAGLALVMYMMALCASAVAGDTIYFHELGADALEMSTPWG